MTAAQPAEDGSLPLALRKLDDALHALCEPRSQLADGRMAYVPSRYLQLQDATGGQQSNPGGGGGSKSRPPLWADAFDQLREIDVAVEAWQPAFNGVPPTVGRLRCLRARGWRPQDTKQIEQITSNLLEWVAAIDALFAEEPVRALWAAQGGGFAACPHCGKTMAKKRDRGGELVQYPALQVLNDGSTRCMACKTSWSPQLAMWVCRQLGYETPVGVLE